MSIKIISLIKWLAVLGILGATAYVQWSTYSSYRAPDPAPMNSVKMQQAIQNAQESRYSNNRDVVTQVRQAMAREARNTSKNITKIVCKSCGGSRMITWQGESRICPVCMGKGYRVLEILPGNVVCPRCGGIGEMLVRNKRNADAETEHCPLCLGSGQVKE